MLIKYVRSREDLPDNGEVFAVNLMDGFFAPSFREKSFQAFGIGTHKYNENYGILRYKTILYHFLEGDLDFSHPTQDRTQEEYEEAQKFVSRLRENPPETLYLITGENGPTLYSDAFESFLEYLLTR